MIDLYYWTTPNGHKITLFLEEAGVPYKIHPVNLGKGDQHKPEFLRISPNGKMPAIVDNAPADGGAPLAVFESGEILFYLAEKTGRFLPLDVRGKHETMTWLFWQMAGLGPILGQNHHFRNAAAEKIPYAVERYGNEAKRLFGVLNERLTSHDWLGRDYSIADMAAYPWATLYKNQGVDIETFPAVKRWLDAIAARPATKRAYDRAKEFSPLAK